MAGAESKGSRRYDKENILWQSTVAIKSDPVGSGMVCADGVYEKGTVNGTKFIAAAKALGAAVR